MKPSNAMADLKSENNALNQDASQFKSSNVTSDTDGPSASRACSYRNTYGDFYFSKTSETCKFLDHSREKLGAQNNVLFVELEGFERSGPFPFFKLPDVIRRRVFELLCGPFYNNEGYITVSLMKSDWCDINQPGWWNASFEEYWAWKLQYREETRPLNTLTAEDRAEKEKRAAYWQKHHLRYQSTLRGRTGRYYMEASPKRKDAKKTGAFVYEEDISMVNLVRNLSHVSTQTRTELGAVFWSEVELRWENYLYGNWYGGWENDVAALTSFFEDRPAACRGIKRFYIGISFSGSDDGLDCINPCSALFACISSNLKLDIFELRIYIDRKDVELMAEGAGVLPSLMGVKGMPVAQEFILDANVRSDPNGDSDDSDDGTYEKQEARANDLWKEHPKKIKSLICPNTLRLKSETEMDRYLLSRPTKLRTVGSVDEQEGVSGGE